MSEHQRPSETGYYSPASKSRQPEVSIGAEFNEPRAILTLNEMRSPVNQHATQLGWYPQVPLPSELSEAYQPPSHLFSEYMPTADPSSFSEQPVEYPNVPSLTSTGSDPNFATKANELINKMLGRTPGGTSVVESDSVLDESGRLYHGYKDGKYYLPNDAAEQDRLDLQHEMYRLLFDGWLALAPMLSPPKYVLDIGTGTGIWAREFAEQNPSSYVIGSDLSAIQPETALPNLAWSKDDAEDSWVYPLPPSHLTPDDVRDENAQTHLITFDYVHLRLVFSCFNDPRTVIKHAFNNISPGGWLEFQDLHPDIFQANPEFEGNALRRWAEACGRGARTVGRNLYVAKEYKRWMEEAGFINVKEIRFVLPSHQWMEGPKLKQIGAFSQRNFIEGVRGGGWKMLKASGMTAEEIEELISQVHTELRIRRNHIYGYVYVVFGQKPSL